VPVLVAACGSNQGSGFLLGAFSSPTKPPEGNARVRASTGNGAVIGGISGNNIGRQMSTRERSIAADAEYRALEYGRSGAPMAWTYPAMNHRGSIVPGRPYRKGEQYCRTYTHSINRGGSPEIVKGVACRDDDGTWRGIS
jgi:surface antigen